MCEAFAFEDSMVFCYGKSTSRENFPDNYSRGNNLCLQFEEYNFEYQKYLQSMNKELLSFETKQWIVTF